MTVGRRITPETKNVPIWQGVSNWQFIKFKLLIIFRWNETFDYSLSHSHPSMQADKWRKFVSPLLLASFLAAVAAQPAEAQYRRAEVQFIHNAADPALETVDIYVNGSRMVDDLSFREATPYMDLASGTELNVMIADGAGTGLEDEIISFPMMFQEGRRYVVVASGVLYPADFTLNPAGESIDFRLYVQEGARAISSIRGMAQFFVMHGVTDAPALSFGQPGLAVGSLEFGELTGYHTLRPIIYFMPLVSGGERVAAVIADLRSLGGSAGAILLSGFASPPEGAQGLRVMLGRPDGSVVLFPIETVE